MEKSKAMQILHMQEDRNQEDWIFLLVNLLLKLKKLWIFEAKNQSEHITNV